MVRRAITDRGLVPPPASQAPLGDALLGTELCRLFVPGDPQTKARARVLKNGRAYTPHRTHDAEETIRWHLLGLVSAPDADHELRVELAFRTATRQRRDIDNLVKLVLDAANGWLWRDDNQITELAATLERGHKDPGTTLVVSRLRRYTADCRTCGRVISKPSGGRRTDILGFCSRECYDHAQRKGNVGPCLNCGEPVYRQVSRREIRRFCDKDCRAAWLKGKPRHTVSSHRPPA